MSDRWISVEDRLPHGEEVVLGWLKTSEECFIGKIRISGDVIVIYDCMVESVVSHWTFLPTPPEAKP